MNSQHPPRVIWYDGALLPWKDATVHVSELQWSGVGSVFEGLRAYWARGVSHVFGLDAHLRRLGRSMRMMGIEGVSLDTLREATLEVIRVNEARADEYIRIFVWFHEGWNYTTKQQVHAFVMSRPFPSQLGEAVTWSAAVSSWRRLDDASFPSRAKAVANYQSSRAAGTEAERRGYDFPILLNARGEVAEGPRECVFLVEGGSLHTPPLHAGVLDSVTRRTVLRLAEHLQIRAIERPILRPELVEADEMFTAATASEIMPVVTVDGVALGDGRTAGPITGRVRELYRRVVRGETDVLADMRVEVKIP